VPYEWSFAAASAIHRNVVRVPAYAVRGWCGPEHRWLDDYIDVPALGIVVGDTILPASETAQPYLLRWNANEGVRIDEATAPPLPSEPEDGWW
jgi:hypothetical protein